MSEHRHEERYRPAWFAAPSGAGASDATWVVLGDDPAVLPEQPRATVPNDFTIIRIGGSPSSAFLEQAGVQIVRKEMPLREAEVASVG